MRKKLEGTYNPQVIGIRLFRTVWLITAVGLKKPDTVIKNYCPILKPAGTLGGSLSMTVPSSVSLYVQRLKS